MSRLGDLLHTERLRRNMTLKQVAKLGGVSEGYLKDVEAGTRIIADDQARRILKKMGLSEQNEAGFSLDDIAATVDLQTAAPKAAPKPAPRSKVLSLKEAEFVQALTAFGISPMKIAFKHLLPNTVGPIVVNITLSTAMFILQEASLSVLGYGVPQEIATWGNIINVITNAGSIRYDWLGYWWMWLPCAAVLVLFVLAINFIGDGLRDASDPTQIG